MDIKLKNKFVEFKTDKTKDKLLISFILSLVNIKGLLRSPELKNPSDHTKLIIKQLTRIVEAIEIELEKLENEEG